VLVLYLPYYIIHGIS